MLTSCHFTRGVGGIYTWEHLEQLWQEHSEFIPPKVPKVSKTASWPGKNMKRGQPGSFVKLETEDVTWTCELCRVLEKKLGQKCWVEAKRQKWTFSASAPWPQIKFHLHWMNLIALYFSKSTPRAIFIGSTFNGINSPFVVNFDSFKQSQPVWLPQMTGLDLGKQASL